MSELFTHSAYFNWFCLNFGWVNLPWGVENYRLAYLAAPFVGFVIGAVPIERLLPYLLEEDYPHLRQPASVLGQMLKAPLWIVCSAYLLGSSMALFPIEVPFMIIEATLSEAPKELPFCDWTGPPPSYHRLYTGWLILGLLGLVAGHMIGMPGWRERRSGLLVAFGLYLGPAPWFWIGLVMIVSWLGLKRFKPKLGHLARVQVMALIAVLGSVVLGDSMLFAASLILWLFILRDERMRASASS